MQTAVAIYLEREGLTQTGLANLIGVKQSMVSDWARGKRRPSLKNALALDRLSAGEIPVSYWASLEKNSKRRQPKRRRRNPTLEKAAREEGVIP